MRWIGCLALLSAVSAGSLPARGQGAPASRPANAPLAYRPAAAPPFADRDGCAFGAACPGARVTASGSARSVPSGSLLPGSLGPVRSDTVIRHSSGALVLGGAIGWALGVVGGGFIGAGVEVRNTEHCYDWCGAAGFLLGAIVGESLLVPLGVHIANGRQGTYGKSAAASLGIAAAGLVLAPITAGVSILPIFPVQLGVSIRRERNTARLRGGG